jgi:hypothetical protein
LQLRIANNLAAAYTDDEPLRATEIARDALEVAREIGDRGMYNFLLGSLATGLIDDGREWDAHIELMRDTLESATLTYDRARLRIILGLFEIARGENLDELVADVTALAGDSDDPDLLLGVYMARCERARLRGEDEVAFQTAMQGIQLKHQNPEISAFAAMDAAIWGRNLEHMRIAYGHVSATPQSGTYFNAYRSHATGAVAALEGRAADAVAALRDARNAMRQMQQHYVAARMDVNAAILLPGEPEVRAWAEATRPLLEELRARPYLERLDAALAEGESSPASATRSGASVEAVSG